MTSDVSETGSVNRILGDENSYALMTNHTNIRFSIKLHYKDTIMWENKSGVKYTVQFKFGETVSADVLSSVIMATEERLYQTIGEPKMNETVRFYWTYRSNKNITFTDPDQCDWEVVKDWGMVRDTLIFTANQNQVLSCDRDGPISGEQIFQPPSEVEGILTIVCLSVSLVCLSARIVMQFCVKRYNTFSCKLQFHFAIALFVASSAYLAGPFVYALGNPTACNIVATLKYSMYLASFFWVNGIAFDTCRVIRSTTKLVSSSSIKFSLFGFIVYGWIFPILCGAAVLSLNYLSIPDKFQPHFSYGITLNNTQGTCWFPSVWFTENYSLLIYFYIPFALSIFANMLFFIIMVYVLCKMFSKTKSVLNTPDQNVQYGIFIKLFFILGLAWILPLVGAFFTSRILNIIAIIFNASQGFFFFLAYTCNKQTCDSLHDKFHSESTTTESDKTKLSRLNSNNKTASTNGVESKYNFSERL